MKLASAFTPDDERYEGVRPIQIFAMRVGYMLVFVPVALPIAVMPWGYVFRKYIWGRPWRDEARKVAFS